MNFTEKTLNSKRIFDGRVINLRVDEVLLPNGKSGTREIVEHNGGVAIVAVKDDRIIMVKQYRKPFEEAIIELPAGKIEKNEDPYICAMRELQEETGFRASSLELLSTIYTTPGFSNEKLHIYLAKNIEAGITSMDEDEFMELHYYKISEILDMIKQGKIYDAKTICGILMYVQYKLV